MTGHVCAYNLNEERGVFLFASRILALVGGIFGDKVHIFMRKYPPYPHRTKNKGACSDKDPDP